jgi:2-iminobutanoate/2-iminopropanoate deaminase
MVLLFLLNNNPSKKQKMKRIINTENAPKAVGPYSQAVEANGFLFVSGQIPINPAAGAMVEGGIEEQTEQVMKNIGAILKEAGLNYANVVKTTCLLSNMDNFAAFNQVYARYFTENMPARATYGVVKLPLGALVEVELIACK